MKPTCEEVEQWISQSLDGALSPDQETGLDEHLANCEPCRIRRKAWGMQTQLLQAAATEGRPTAAAMWKDVQAEIQQLNASRSPGKMIRFQRRLFAVAALLLLGLGLYLIVRSVMQPGNHLASGTDPDAELAEYSVESPIEGAATMNWVDEETGIVVFWVDEPITEDTNHAG